MPGGIFSRVGITLADDWSEPATFRVGGIDKLDVQVYDGDALVQFAAAGGWLPADGLALTRGLFRSVPGLALIYPPSGPTGMRFRRRVAGVASSVNFDAFQI